MADDNGPWYGGLIEEFDRVHRGRAIENRKNVVAMRMRGHAANDFPYDVRYEPYIARLGLLPSVLQFRRNPPPVNHAVLTAHTDHWRPDTHSFHLPCGEMTMTLEDMAMRSGLPLNGDAVTGHVSVVNCRQRVGVLIGVEPPPPLPGKPNASKVKHSWLKEVRGGPCPADAGDIVVQQYARAYLWYILTNVVFTYATGNSALWMYLETKESSSLCGFVWILSVWMWERLPVGWPMLKNHDNPNPNPHEGLHDVDLYRRPTVAYHWDQVSVYTGSSHVRYKCYVNELDTLVFWRPYEEDLEYDLNQMCTRDSNIWRSRCPTICFYAVEFHFVDRVARQFGKRQGIPTEETRSVITSLHGNNQDLSDWAAKHQTCISMWNQRETLIDKENKPHNDSAYQKYLVWYVERYRLKLKPGWTRQEWSELVSEDPSAAEGYHAFNMVVRETGGSQVDYAPMHDELGREFLMCVNDANVPLSHPRGCASFERTLRTTLEKFKSRFHKWAAMLSCHGAQSVDVFTGGTSRSSRARRHQLAIDFIEEEEEEETAQEHEVDIYAPQPSQPSQPSQSRKKKTPRAARKKRLNSRFRSPEYSHKNLPKGMRYIEEEEDEEEEEEEDIEEEEAEG
ncbi:hypothetical protein ZWY2020_050632 [Hordeum vulgare]|nr:hypothetical protein ZWY2020_050632 [Hordeum vulgare]